MAVCPSDSSMTYQCVYYTVPQHSKCRQTLFYNKIATSPCMDQWTTDTVHVHARKGQNRPTIMDNFEVLFEKNWWLHTCIIHTWKQHAPIINTMHVLLHNKNILQWKYVEAQRSKKKQTHTQKKQVISVSNWSKITQVCNVLFLLEDVFSETELVSLHGKIRIGYFMINAQKFSTSSKVTYHVSCRGGLLLCSLPRLGEPPPAAGRMDWRPS